MYVDHRYLLLLVFWNYAVYNWSFVIETDNELLRTPLYYFYNVVVNKQYTAR